MPADYVNKLARMFQDIKVSEDLNQVFKEMHKHNKLALPGNHTRTRTLVYKSVEHYHFILICLFHQFLCPMCNLREHHHCYIRAIILHNQDMDAFLKVCTLDYTIIVFIRLNLSINQV